MGGHGRTWEEHGKTWERHGRDVVRSESCSYSRAATNVQLYTRDVRAICPNESASALGLAHAHGSAAQREDGRTAGERDSRMARQQDGKIADAAFARRVCLVPGHVAANHGVKAPPDCSSRDYV
jgi:hypothetical protein